MIGHVLTETCYSNQCLAVTGHLTCCNLYVHADKLMRLPLSQPVSDTISKPLCDQCLSEFHCDTLIHHASNPSNTARSGTAHGNVLHHVIWHAIMFCTEVSRRVRILFLNQQKRSPSLNQDMNARLGTAVVAKMQCSKIHRELAYVYQIDLTK